MTVDSSSHTPQTGRAAHYRHTVVGRVFLARWIRSPDRPSLDSVVRDLRAARQRAAKPLVYCAYIGEDAEMLSAESRRILPEYEPKMLESSDSIHVVFAGAGTVIRMLLTIRRSMNILTPYRSKVFLHTSLEQFMRAVQGTSDTDLAALTRAVQELRASNDA